MPDDSHIPVLTDLIEAESDMNLPDIGLDADHDPLLDENDGLEFTLNTEIQPTIIPVETNQIDGHPELEQSIRRILDEHMELAWQEIKLAIEKALGQKIS